MRLLGLLLFTSLIFPLPDDFQGKVVSIADGDTVTVLRGREQVKVRLNGIDAPEKNQSFGTKSKDALAALAFGNTVTVRSSGTDRYGRTLGVIVADGVNVNEQLVANGWAWHYKQYSTDAKLAQLEASAKAGGKGLWADPNQSSPWGLTSSTHSCGTSSLNHEHWNYSSTNHAPTACVVRILSSPLKNPCFPGVFRILGQFLWPSVAPMQLGAWRLRRCISRRAPQIESCFESRESPKHWGFAWPNLAPIHADRGCRIRTICSVLLPLAWLSMFKRCCRLPTTHARVGVVLGASAVREYSRLSGTTSLSRLV